MTERDRQGRQGAVEPCPQCGAPLAADQRYCLNCGRRRGEPRLDFSRHLPDQRPAAAADAKQAAATPAAAAPEQGRQRDFAPLAAAGGIAVLGLMLLVGVLIGRSDSDPSAAPAPPPVVRVEGGGGETASEETGAQKGGEAKKQTKAKGGGKGGGEETNTGNAVTASDAELKALQGKSPEDYSKAAAELPNEIATPGRAPPKDNEAPGGGSKGTTIE